MSAYWCHANGYILNKSPPHPIKKPKNSLLSVLSSMAAQEGSEASVASSSTAPSNWWEVHPNPLSSWNTMGRWQPPNPHSNSCDEDISNTTTSFTNTSNHSGLTMDSSSANLSGEPAENNLWSQVLLWVQFITLYIDWLNLVERESMVFFFFFSFF